MKFPILSAKELSKIAINKIKTSAVDEREFSFNMISHGHNDFDINDLLELLNSPSEKDVKKGISIFNSAFISLFGVDNHLQFLHIFDAQENAILAKDTLGKDVALLDEGYTTTDTMEDGTLFVWCNEIMFIYQGDTYTITQHPHYHCFTFFEGEPAYVVGKVSESLIEKTIS